MNLSLRRAIPAIAAALLALITPLPSSATDGARQITFGSSSQEPCWSPDGTHILHTSTRGPSHLRHLWTIPAGGGTPTPVTAGFTDGYLSPDYSPDAAWIVCSTVAMPQTYLWKLPGDGGTPVQFTFEGNDQLPVWSPDGTRIAFGSTQGGRGSIWVMPAEGGPATQLTSGPWDREGEPCWSPDGTRIAFTATRSFDGGGIGVIPSDGGPVTMITDSPHPVVGDKSPSWSPDGSRIAFVRYSAGTWDDLWIVPASGEPAMQLTSVAAHDWWPAWSPDGETIAFTSDRSGGWEIWTVPAPLPIAIPGESWGIIKGRFRGP